MHVSRSFFTNEPFPVALSYEIVRPVLTILAVIHRCPCGRVNVCVKPPILKRRSNTRTRHLRSRAMMLANASPPMPEPITIAS